jgi:hypothetical protein
VTTIAVDSSWCVALGDVDGDGALDAVLGPGTLHLNRSPWIANNLAAHALPNDAAHLRWVSATPVAPNHVRVSLRAVDDESDPVWIRGEYQFEGAPTWTPMALAAGGAVAGPFDASPGGVAHDLDWDVTTVPFDRRALVVRLQVLSSPRRAGEIAFVPQYLASVGRVTPHRPSLDVSPASIVFPTVTVGDTVITPIVVANPGNVDLVVQSMTASDPAIDVLAVAGLTVAAGAQQLVPVRLAPRDATPRAGTIHIVGNDPARPSADVAYTSDVRALAFTTQLLAVAPELPLGEAATVVVTPGSGVRIETGWVFYRAHGAAAFADSARLVPQGANFIALVPSGAVTEAGLDYYVRAEKQRRHPHRSRNGARHVLHAAGRVARPRRGARRCRRARRLPGGSRGADRRRAPDGAEYDSGAVFYRMGGSAAYDSLPLVLTEVSPGTIAPAASIPADAVGAARARLLGARDHAHAHAHRSAGDARGFAQVDSRHRGPAHGALDPRRRARIGSCPCRSTSIFPRRRHSRRCCRISRNSDRRTWRAGAATATCRRSATTSRSPAPATRGCTPSPVARSGWCARPPTRSIRRRCRGARPPTDAPYVVTLDPGWNPARRSVRVPGRVERRHGDRDHPAR